MTLTTIIKRKDGIMAADMNGSAVMMDIESGKYYNLGAVGKSIWQIIEEPTAIESLINKLTEEYDVTYERCQNETMAFLEQLVSFGLISKENDSISQ